MAYGGIGRLLGDVGHIRVSEGVGGVMGALEGWQGV